MVRSRFDAQLEQLNVELIKMGALCEEAITASVSALMKYDRTMVQMVFEKDNEIDHMERDIETFCMRLLLQQQPVARDLRTISSALKMISAALKMVTDMERIGDQAGDIAEIMLTLGAQDTQSKLHIQEMARAAVKMVTDAVESFVKKDLALARSVMQYDDVVDGLFDKVKEELIRLILENRENGEFCIDLLMIAKYLERIGDHATNIAEWVEFSITGQHVIAEEERA